MRARGRQRPATSAWKPEVLSWGNGHISCSRPVSRTVAESTNAGSDAVVRPSLASCSQSLSSLWRTLGFDGDGAAPEHGPIWRLSRRTLACGEHSLDGQFPSWRVSAAVAFFFLLVINSERCFGCQQPAFLTVVHVSLGVLLQVRNELPGMRKDACRYWELVPQASARMV